MTKTKVAYVWYFPCPVPKLKNQQIDKKKEKHFFFFNQPNGKKPDTANLLVRLHDPILPHFPPLDVLH